MSGFPSAASAVAILLACVALLVVASALKVAPLFDRPTASRPLVAFAGCLAAIWALAIVAIALIGTGL